MWVHVKLALKHPLSGAEIISNAGIHESAKGKPSKTEASGLRVLVARLDLHHVRAIRHVHHPLRHAPENRLEVKRSQEAAALDPIGNRSGAQVEIPNEKA